MIGPVQIHRDQVAELEKLSQIPIEAQTLEEMQEEKKSEGGFSKDLNFAVSNIKRRRKRDMKVDDKQDAKTCKMRQVRPQQHKAAMSAFKMVRKS